MELEANKALEDARIADQFLSSKAWEWLQQKKQVLKEEFVRKSMQTGEIEKDVWAILKGIEYIEAELKSLRNSGIMADDALQKLK